MCYVDATVPAPLQSVLSGSLSPRRYYDFSTATGPINPTIKTRYACGLHAVSGSLGSSALGSSPATRGPHITHLCSPFVTLPLTTVQTQL